MVFDECPPGDAGLEQTRKSLEMTARWARRSKERFDELQRQGADTGHIDVGFGIADLGSKEDPISEFPNPTSLSGHQALFGIIQGAGHLDLRQQSLELTCEIGFDGYAIGGLSVGEEKSVMYDVLEYLAPQMPADSPRYLMGVGTPEDLIEGVRRGVDMFDCVMPTRNGRTGGAFTSRGKINIRNARYALDQNPLDEECPCSVCRRYSRAYLRHLYQAGEMLAATMISHHNLAFYLNLMKRIRKSIIAGEFEAFRTRFLAHLENE